MGNRTGEMAVLPVPQDVTAERAVLASCISLPDAMVEVALILRQGDFSRQEYGIIYGALLDLWQQTGTVDVVSLRIALQNLPPRQQRVLLQAAGAPADTSLEDGAWMMELVNKLWEQGLGLAGATRYARRVADLARLRRLIQVGGQIAALGYERLSEEQTIEGILGQAERLLIDVTGDGRAEDVVSIKAALNSYLERLEERARGGNILPGLSTGFPDLDRLTSGMVAPDLWVVSGPTGGGKTSLVMQLIRGAALSGGKVLLASLEMSLDQVVQRFLSREAAVDGTWLRMARLGQDEWAAVNEGAGLLSEMGIYLTDRRGLTVLDIMHRARKAKLTTGLDLLVVDYLGLLKPLDDRGNKASDLEEIAYGLKTLASELDVTVVAPAQLSRETVKSTPPTEWLYGHKYSSGIEQAADVCISVYFPEDTRTQDKWEDDNGKLEPGLYITKQRNGPTGSVPMTFDRATNTIRQSRESAELRIEQQLSTVEEEEWRW